MSNPRHEGTDAPTPVTSACRAPEMRISLSSRRTSPLVFDRTQNNRALHVDAANLKWIYDGDTVPLAKWVNLQRLDLGRSKIISVAPIAGLTALRRLDLWRTKGRDIAPIEALENLERLSLGHTLVTDISPLANLVKLRILDLSDTR